MQLLRFGAVGTSAAAVHYLTVIALVSRYAVHPLSANVLAFAVAFWVSYGGHRSWTFETDRQHRQTLPRFLLVAVASFVLNQGLFALLLKTCPFLPYYISLAIVLLGVAGLTFVVSNTWAFRPRVNEETGN